MTYLAHTILERILRVGNQPVSRPHPSSRIGPYCLLTLVTAGCGGQAIDFSCPDSVCSGYSQAMIDQDYSAAFQFMSSGMKRDCLTVAIQMSLQEAMVPVAARLRQVRHSRFERLMFDHGVTVDKLEGLRAYGDLVDIAQDGGRFYQAVTDYCSWQRRRTIVNMMEVGNPVCCERGVDECLYEFEHEGREQTLVMIRDASNDIWMVDAVFCC